MTRIIPGLVKQTHVSSVFHPLTNSLNPGNRRVLKRQFFARMDNVKGCLTSQSSFMKAAKDQFEFARVCIDISDSKDPGDVGGVVKGIDLNSVFIQSQTPVSDRSKLGG